MANAPKLSGGLNLGVQLVSYRPMPVTFGEEVIGFSFWLGVLAAYALGCLNTGYYLVRWKTGRDVRESGSGSAGAKNVGRALGPWGFGISLVGDMGKGVLAVFCAQTAGFSPLAQGFVMLAVIAGHNWPGQLGFRGGKGAATSFGALLFLDPAVAGSMLAVFVMLYAAMRRTTLSAMGAYAASPFLGLFFGRGALDFAIYAGMAALVLVPHWKNIRDELDHGRAVTKI